MPKSSVLPVVLGLLVLWAVGWLVLELASVLIHLLLLAAIAVLAIAGWQWLRKKFGHGGN